MLNERLMYNAIQTVCERRECGSKEHFIVEGAAYFNKFAIRGWCLFEGLLDRGQ